MSSKQFRFGTAAIILFAATITGCSKEPPACNSPETLNLVKQIVSEQVDKSIFYKANPVDIAQMLEVRLPAPTDYNEKIKKYSCSGTLELAEANFKDLGKRVTETLGKEASLAFIDMFEKSAIADFSLIGSQKNCKEGKCSANIEFSSQIVGDSVQVGVTGRYALMLVLAGAASHAEGLITSARQDSKSDKNHSDHWAAPQLYATPQASGSESSGMNHIGDGTSAVDKVDEVTEMSKTAQDCIAQAKASMEVSECLATEAAVQDKRIAVAYEKATSPTAGSTTNMQILDQRKWLAAQEAYCDQQQPESQAMLSCLIGTSQARADALEKEVAPYK